MPDRQRRREHHPLGKRTTRPAARLSTLAAATLLSGCGLAVQPLDVKAPQADSAACARVLDALPDSNNGLDAVPTDGTGSAAWGDPPVVLQCGLKKPAPSTTFCADVDGTDWLAVDDPNGVSFTTYGRDPAIRVFVPAAYPQAAEMLLELKTAVGQVKQTSFCQ